MPRVAVHMDEHQALAARDPHVTETLDDLAKRLADDNPEGRELVELILQRKAAAGFCESYKNFKESTEQ